MGTALEIRCQLNKFVHLMALPCLVAHQHVYDSPSQVPFPQTAENAGVEVILLHQAVFTSSPPVSTHVSEIFQSCIGNSLYKCAAVPCKTLNIAMCKGF